MENQSFQRGERLEFRLHYGFIDAGEAVLEVQNKSVQFNGAEAFHILGTGRSTGAFDWFFTVRDTYQTYLDQQNLVPHHFIRSVNEGGYQINREILFNQTDGKLEVKEVRKGVYSEKKFDVPQNIQDLLSAYFYARCLDYSAMQIGDTIQFNTFFDNELYPLTLKFHGREVLKTKFGKVKCLKFKPMLQVGRIFEEEEDMTIWFSDDKNHIPLRIQADIVVGSVKADLKKYQNLKHPLALVKR